MLAEVRMLGESGRVVGGGGLLHIFIEHILQRDKVAQYTNSILLSHTGCAYDPEAKPFRLNPPSNSNTRRAPRTV